MPERFTIYRRGVGEYAVRADSVPWPGWTNTEVVRSDLHDSLLHRLHALEAIAEKYEADRLAALALLSQLCQVWHNSGGGGKTADRMARLSSRAQTALGIGDDSPYDQWKASQ